MPRKKPDRVPAILALLPNTRFGLADALGVSAKVMHEELQDMKAKGLIHQSEYPVKLDAPRPGKKSGRLTNVCILYVAGKAPTGVEKPFNRDLLLPKKFNSDIDEPRVDPTLNLYREPLNALFGM